MTNYHIPSYLNFDKRNYPWQPDIDYRKEPQKYRVGKGEQGVLNLSLQSSLPHDAARKGHGFQIIDVDQHMLQDLTIKTPYNRLPALIQRDLVLY